MIETNLFQYKSYIIRNNYYSRGMSVNVICSTSNSERCRAYQIIKFLAGRGQPVMVHAIYSTISLTSTLDAPKP